jgi:hypothetical protein
MNMIHSFSSIRFFLVFLSPIPCTLSPFLGSCAEVETRLLLAQDLNYISLESCGPCLLLLKEISRILQVMIPKLKGR